MTQPTAAPLVADPLEGTEHPVPPPETMRSRAQIIRDSGHYLAATILAQVVGLGRSLLMPVLLTPAQLGIWNLMNVVISYGEKAQIGLLDGMNKAIPMMRGSGRTAAIEPMKDSVFWTTMTLGLAGALVTWGVSWWTSPAYAPALRIIAVVVLLQMPFLYLFSLLRVDNRFRLLSVGAASLSLLSSLLIIVVAFASADHLRGALLGLAGAYAPVVLYLFAAGRYRFAPQIRLDALREALVLGVPVKMIGLIEVFFLSIDRWVIAGSFGEKSLGYYALAIMVTSLLCLIPGSVSSVVYTRMLERFAVDGDPRAARTLLIPPLRALAALMIVISVGAMIVIPAVITILLPKYLPSIPLLQALVAGGFFQSIGMITATYLMAIDRQVLMMKMQVIVALLTLSADLLAVRLGFGLEAIAIVTSVAYATVALGYTVPAFWLACRDRREVARQLARLVLPVLVMLGSTTLAYFLFPGRGGTIRELSAAAERLVMVLGCVLLALWQVNRDGELLAIVRTELQNSKWLRWRRP